MPIPVPIPPEPRPLDGDWEVVYEANYRAAGRTVDVLQDAGLTAVVVDPMPSAAWQMGRVDPNYAVRIAVPPGEADTARKILAEWDRRSTEEVDRISSRFIRYVLAFAIAFAISALVCLVWTEEAAVIVGIAAVVSFVLVWGVTSRRARNPGSGRFCNAGERHEDRS